MSYKFSAQNAEDAARDDAAQNLEISPTAVSRRLDALPFSRKHLRVLTGSGVGWALDAMDVGLVSFIIAALSAEWSLSKGEGGLIASIGFLGMAIGASLGGLLADRFGRRQVFALTLLCYGLATGASALAGGLAVLLVLRFFVGLGLGAELPVAVSYVSEFAPARIRGRLIVILEAFWAVGWTLAALIGYFVIPGNPAGWKIALALGAVPAIYAAVVRWALPESPRWLASRGRGSAALAVVYSFEAATQPAGASRQHTEDHAALSRSRAAQHSQAKARLWDSEHRVRTAAIWLVWAAVNFAYYGAFIWIPSILLDQGFDLVRSFGFTLVMTLAQLPGYALAAWLIEKWGRRLTLSLFLLGAAGAALWFGSAHTVPVIIAAGALLSFMNLGAWGALYAVTPELYPTRLRGTGSGQAAAFGRLASIAAPLVTPLLLASGGPVLAFAVFAGCFVLAAAAVWGLVEYTGRALAED